MAVNCMIPSSRGDMCLGESAICSLNAQQGLVTSCYVMLLDKDVTLFFHVVELRHRGTYFSLR